MLQVAVPGLGPSSGRSRPPSSSGSGGPASCKGATSRGSPATPARSARSGILSSPHSRRGTWKRTQKKVNTSSKFECFWFVHGYIWTNYNYNFSSPNMFLLARHTGRCFSNPKQDTEVSKTLSLNQKHRSASHFTWLGTIVQTTNCCTTCYRSLAFQRSHAHS